MATAICFENVSKRFILRREQPRSFQEIMVGLLRKRRPPEEFWALQDVSFEVQHGEAVGLIGPNGAGKSTVPKLISRIIEPTSGQIEVNGRVTAFHQVSVGCIPRESKRTKSDTHTQGVADQ